MDQIHVCSTLKLLTIISDYLIQWFSKLSVCQNHQDGLLKHRLPGPAQFDSVDTECTVIIHLSNRFPGGAEVAYLRSTF